MPHFPSEELKLVATVPLLIIKAADLDEMKVYRKTAEDMEIGDAVDLNAATAPKMVKAIEDKYGPRTYRTKKLEGGITRVFRVPDRPLVARKPKAAKKTAEPKAKKNA